MSCGYFGPVIVGGYQVGYLPAYSVVGWELRGGDQGDGWSSYRGISYLYAGISLWSDLFNQSPGSEFEVCQEDWETVVSALEFIAEHPTPANTLRQR